MTFSAYQGWWCVGQVTLLAMLGAAATSVWLRRYPAATARVAGAAAVTILAVTLLALTPFPHWVSWQSVPSQALTATTAAELSAPSADAPANDSSPALHASTIIDLYAALARSLRATAQYPVSHCAPRWIAALAATGITIGLARFVWALAYLRRLYAKSRPLAGGQVAAIAAQLAAALGVSQRFELRQTVCLISPAVIGWRRPAILLPAAWSAWSSEQLRAALAHELAHIRRGDSLTRLAATLATALHFYHPLVHWLSARLALSQELAADRLAAAAVGGDERYLRAISQLAIWLDEQPRLRAEPLVLPALSSNLIRRITMLRTMDGPQGGHGPHRIATLAAALVAIVGLATTALRGDAADVSHNDTQPASPLSSSTSGDLFRRQPLDFSVIGDNKSGAFVIRVDEIMQRPVLRAFVESDVFPEALIKQVWTQEFGTDTAPPAVRLDAIDYVAGVGTFAIRPLKPEQATHGASQSVMFGSAQTVIHFKHAVAWREWIHDHLPGAAEKSQDGVNYVELPVIKFLGPAAMCIAARDPQTIVVNFPTNPGRIVEAAAPGPRPAQSPLAARWAELDGGLATFITTDADINATESAPTTPEKVLAEKFFAASRLLGIGFDMDPQTRAGIFHVQLTCESYEAAQEQLGTFESLLALAKVALAAEAATSTSSTPASSTPTDDQPQATAQQIRFASELTSNCHANVWQQLDGSAGITIESKLTLPDIAAPAVALAPEKPTETPAAPK